MSLPELDVTAPIPLAYGFSYLNQSNPPCGMNSSFIYYDFNAPGSDTFPSTAFYVGGTIYWMHVLEIDWNFDNPNFTFTLLYRATLDPTATENWTDLLPMIEVQSGVSAPGLMYQDVTAPVEWAGNWGVAQTVIVTDEDPPRYGFQCAVVYFASGVNDLSMNNTAANDSDLTITPVYYDESLIPVGKAGFIWPTNNTQPTYTSGPTEPPEPSATSSPHTGLSGGVIAGIVVGTVAGVVIVLALGLWIFILKRKTALPHPRSSGPEVSGGK